jgi:hypothetical protein
VLLAYDRKTLEWIGMTGKTGALLLLLMAGFLIPADALAACVVNAMATIPLTVSGGVIIAPVEVNGISASFIVDTGAARSLVTPEAAQRLGLARDLWVGSTMSGIGGIDGIERPPNAEPRSLSLGGVPLMRRTLNHDTSLAVGVMPNARAGDRVIDGLLGRDFLSIFDLDLDVAGGRLTLYQVNDCSGRFLSWRDDYAAIPVTFVEMTALVLPVTLDDTPLRALLDTGASASILAAPGIARLGLQPNSLARDASGHLSGLGPRIVTAHRHQFRSLLVGGQAIISPTLWVEPVRLRPIADMLLGADWLARRRIWISFATRQLFVATP